MGEALSCVVHDIRGPLTNAQLLVDYLHRADESLFSQVELFDMLEHSLGQVLEVVNDTLDYVRGSVRIEKREVELEPELSHSLELLGLELGRRAVPLRIAIPPGLRARVDILPLVRALRNLAVNASEALGATPAPWVEVGAESRDSGVRIWVEDNGPGIPDAMRERLFAPFASAGKAQGTGLGLAVVKIMVEAHDGTITVHSSDKGTRFEIDLPE
jgi:signal transduction histidine kinase